MSQSPAQPVSRSAAEAGVKRQIRLPISKAIEIAYKSIRLRLSRSLVVTSGIVLALAFLMSILTGEAMTAAMRDWAQNAPGVAALADRRKAAEAALAPLYERMKAEVPPAAIAAPSGAKPDAEDLLGAELPAIQKEVGLPVAPDQLARALADPAVVDLTRQWLIAARDLRAVRDEQTAPQQLLAQMKANGVPTTPEEIADNRIQTRWLVTLALLVAFVGILNAMLMSVTERFREIGTMKCLGALDSFIIKLFLIESLFQGVVGTVLGVLLGLGVSVMASGITYGNFAFRNFPTAEIAGAAAVSLVIGTALTVAGAVYPAWTAARMQPIEAMRVET